MATIEKNPLDVAHEEIAFKPLLYVVKYVANFEFERRSVQRYDYLPWLKLTDALACKRTLEARAIKAFIFRCDFEPPTEVKELDDDDDKI